MFYLVGIIITFFLSILLIGKKGKSEADQILTIWLMFTGLHLITFYLYLSGNYIRFPWLLGIEVPLPLVHGPFLFLYTTSLTQQRRIKFVGSLHYLPVLVTYFLMIPFFLRSTDQKIYVYQHNGAGYEWLTSPIFIAIIVSGISYVILSFLKLRQHKLNIENRFSNTAKINLNWLRYLIYGTSVIWIVIISGLPDTYIFATVVLYVFFIGYFGIKQVGIFSNTSQSQKNITNEQGPKLFIEQPVNDLTESVLPDAKPKYQKSSLSEGEAKRIHEHLHQLMANEKLFKDPDLNLGELAAKLDVHQNVLSQVINSFESRTFYDYINGLRVEEFKILVADPVNNQYTLLSLAFECGFNSKTAFNRNFKKTTGLSPSEYLDQIKINLPDRI
jgi:AraC-like DNA-binding protein